MSISSSRSAWNPNDTTTEVPAFKATKTLTLVAGTEEDAVFLARLAACIRRGRPISSLVIAVEARHLRDAISLDQAMAGQCDGW